MTKHTQHIPTVGQAVPHDSGRGHVTGEALYIDDYTPMAGELFVEFVGSPTACGQITSVDISEAKRVPGVVGVYTHKDILGHNLFGAVFHDEPFLAEEKVIYVGQPVVVIAGESREAARAGRKAVKVEVSPETPVLDIDTAIEKQQFLGPERRIERGDFDSAWTNAAHQIEGTFESNGQEQFYLESQACIAYPGENGQIAVESSTQNPTETQAVLAEVLGLGMHEVVVRCKRMGGAFGGKETQAAIPALMAALVTQKTGRAARVVYTKDDDMKVTGKRHPYKTWYKAGFDNEGRLNAVKLDFYSDGGATADLSTGIMERTLLHADNAYYLPNVKLKGRICKTNIPPNTAFRGFGGPQAIAVIENIIQEVAARLGKDALEVRRLNCYGDAPRNTTPYGQEVKNNLLPQIFEQLAQTSDYKARLAEAETFNKQSPTHLKGLAMTAVKFGISFTTKFLNQGNALVGVYTDGTVQVSTGATEMGQGVNTKIRQIVADEFGLAIDRVLVMTTSTEKNINTSPTAASAGTDLNGAAAVNACDKIRKRMAIFAAELFSTTNKDLAPNPDNIRFESGHVFDDRAPDNRIPFGEFTNKARMARVDLGARGFYATPGIDFDRETGKGNPFFYYTTGAAVTEVLIDRFTGDLRVTGVDLLMDIGRMINPGIDHGQVIGGFVQGMGWCTTENLVYNDKGELLSYSPTTYKIPNITDIPERFNFAFVENGGNAKNIRSSKAVGEPPLMLGISAWAAAKHALSCVASTADVPLKLPATNEEVLMCLTRILRDANLPTPRTADRH
jgi:xanthine dehydrogenase large subunit